MNKQVCVCIFFLLAINFVYAERAYKYVRTVNPGSINDFKTINEAIEDINNCDLSPDGLGCIKIYPGIYAEQINSFYPGGNNLPAHCDLIGMGASPEDVVIQHQRRSSSDPNFVNIVSEIYADGLLCEGDNLVENIKIHNTGQNQNSIEFRGTGTLSNCIVISRHDALTSSGHLVVKGCTIEGWYRPCIHAYSTFNISDSTFYPKTPSWGGQHPAGIKAYDSGIIDNVTITADVASSDYEPHYDAPWLAGVIAFLAEDEEVVISNTTIDLNLTTLYHEDRPDETATWQLFGVVSGGRNPNPTTRYPGKVTIQDCTIRLNGIEQQKTDSISESAVETEQAHEIKSGRGIMVSGVCVRGSGTVDVIGETTIETSRTSGAFAQDGYDYAFNNQNGKLNINFNTVSYDDTKSNGELSKYVTFKERFWMSPVLVNTANLDTSTLHSSYQKISESPGTKQRAIAEMPSAIKQTAAIETARIVLQTQVSNDSTAFESRSKTASQVKSVVNLTSITTSTILDPTQEYYIPDPPLLIHGDIEVVIPANTYIGVAGSSTAVAVKIYGGANVYFGGVYGENENIGNYPDIDPNTPVKPVWIVGHSPNVPFFNNPKGILIERTAGAKTHLKNIYLEGFFSGLEIDKQLENPVENIYANGCYHGLTSYGPNRIFNSYVDYFGYATQSYPYYGFAYDFVSQSMDGTISFAGETYHIYNCLANNGDYGFTARGVTSGDAPVFKAGDNVASNCWMGFHCVGVNLLISVLTPGLYNNNYNSNFSELLFTSPIYETSNPIVYSNDDYRIFLNSDSNFVDAASGITQMRGWTTRSDGKPDTGFEDIWLHYQTKRSEGNLIADIDNDRVVDVNDLAEMSNEWLAETVSAADLDNDANVNLIDYSLLASEWQKSELSVQILDSESLIELGPNSLSNDILISVKSLPESAISFLVYLDDNLIETVWYYDSFDKLIGIATEEYLNGWHSLRIVSLDVNGKVINHKNVRVFFDNLLHGVTAAEHFESGENYEYKGFYDGSLTVRAELKDVDDQIIWTNDFAGSIVDVNVPSAIFTNQGYCELEFTEVDTLLIGSLVMNGDSIDKKLKKAISKKFDSTITKMAIIAPFKSIFKARKDVIKAVIQACEKRNVSWQILYKKQANKGNISRLFKSSGLKYIYWAGHGNNKVNETVPRISVICWDKYDGWFKDWQKVRAVSAVSTEEDSPAKGYPPLPPVSERDFPVFDLHELGMHDDAHKKIVFIDACLSGTMRDMAATFGMFSDSGYGHKDMVYIGWNKKMHVSSTPMENLLGSKEGLVMFWERLGRGDDVIEALEYVEKYASRAALIALFGEGGDFDYPDYNQTNDNIILGGWGLQVPGNLILGY